MQCRRDCMNCGRGCKKPKVEDVCNDNPFGETIGVGVDRIAIYIIGGGAGVKHTSIFGESVFGFRRQRADGQIDPFQRMAVVVDRDLQISKGDFGGLCVIKRAAEDFCRCIGDGWTIRRNRFGNRGRIIGDTIRTPNGPSQDCGHKASSNQGAAVSRTEGLVIGPCDCDRGKDDEEIEEEEDSGESHCDGVGRGRAGGTRDRFNP